MQQDTDKQTENEQVAQAAQEQAGEGAEQASVEAQLAQAQAKLTEMQDAFLRAKAEVENMRRRAADDVAKAHKFATEGFAESLLSVRDSLEMALAVEIASVESLKEGVDMTLKQLVTAFEKNKVQEINPAQGEKLDPMVHQAISMVPADQEPNTVVTVLQKGYTLADRLLRPALVTVAQGK